MRVEHKSQNHLYLKMVRPAALCGKSYRVRMRVIIFASQMRPRDIKRVAKSHTAIVAVAS